MSSILIVEDDVHVIVVIAMYLESAYREIQTAFCAEEALRKIEEGLRPDLILTDFSMKEMNGAEMIAAIRKLVPNQRFVMMTGSIDVREYLDALGGADVPIFTKGSAQLLRLRQMIEEQLSRSTAINGGADNCPTTPSQIDLGT